MTSQAAIQNLLTPYGAAKRAGVDQEDAMILQTATTAILLAAANGTIDLNALACTELASRGIGREGRWVGYEKAGEAWFALAADAGEK